MRSVCRVYVECMWSVCRVYARSIQTVYKSISKLMKYIITFTLENYFINEIRSIILKNSSKICA